MAEKCEQKRERPHTRGKEGRWYELRPPTGKGDAIWEGRVPS